MSDQPLDAINAELAALAELEAGLKARESDLLAELSEHIAKPPAKLETEHAGLVARLRALPLRRAQLEDQAAAITRAAHLAEFERVHAEHYSKLAALAEFDAKLKQAQEAVSALVKKRGELNAEVETVWRRRAKMGRNLIEAGELTPEEDQALTSRYSYLDRGYPNYDALMRKRAARGHLPPGMSLADFGIEEAAPEEAQG